MEGIISDLNLVRGHGLIRTPSGLQVRFARTSLCGVEMGHLHRGQSVLFELQLGFDGAEAVAVRPAIDGNRSAGSQKR